MGLPAASFPVSISVCAISSRNALFLAVLEQGGEMGGNTATSTSFMDRQ